MVCQRFIAVFVATGFYPCVTDSWQQLRKIHVYLSFFSYFDDVNDQKSRAEYRKILSRLKVGLIQLLYIHMTVM